MENTVVRVVVVGGSVEGSSRQHQNVLAFYEKVNVLESDFVLVRVAAVENVERLLPVFEVVGVYQRKPVSAALVLLTQVADYLDVLSADFITVYFKLREIDRELYHLVKLLGRVGVCRVRLHYQRKSV